MLDYLPKLEEAIDYFFENVFSPGDTLTVVTPIKNYNFKKDSFEKLSREVIVKQLKKKVKKDITIGAREFKSMVRDLDFISESARHGDRTAGIKAIEVQRQLRNFRYISEENIMNFKDYLDNQEGQKHIFFFYQKNNIPVPANLPTLDYFEEGKDIFFDVKKIKHTFSDSSISIHFIFLTKIRQANLDVSRFDSSGIQSVDNSQEIFSTFFEMAKTTGGTTESTANAASGFQRAAHAAENYYLLYYSPKNYKADEKFRRIEVKVKGKGYRVTHRAGYFAN
jgi:VWFA-related protein